MSPRRLRGGVAIPPYIPPDPVEGEAIPHVRWAATGGGGSGWDGDEPVATVRDGPTVITGRGVRNRETVAKQVNLVHDAFDKAGCSVDLLMEGNTFQTTFDDWDYDNGLGGTSVITGYGVPIDFDGIMGLNANGTIKYYWRTTSNNPNVAERIEGPFYLYVRAPGVGAGKQFDFSINLKPDAVGDTAGVQYRTLRQCLSWLIGQGSVRGRVVCKTDSASTGVRYSMAGFVDTDRDHATAWYSIVHDEGIEPHWGNSDTTGANMYCDGVSFDGNHKFELSKCSTNLHSGIWRCHYDSNKMISFRGAEIFGGDAVGTGQTGSGAKLLMWGEQPSQQWVSFDRARFPGDPVDPDAPESEYYVQDCYIHDMPGYGVLGSIQCINTAIDMISGSAFENNRGMAQRLTGSQIGGIQSGLRVPMAAAKLTGPTNSKFQKTGGNGRTSTLNGLVNDVVTESMVLDDSGTSSSTTVEMVRAEINANWAGWNLGAISSETILTAIYLSVADLPPSYSIGLPSDPAANTATPRPVGPTGLDLITIADIHSNWLVIDQSARAQNILYRYVRCFNIVGSAHVVIGNTKDIALVSCDFQDKSQGFGAGSGAAQQSLIHTGCEHFVMAACTHGGPTNSIQFSSGGVVASTESEVSDSFFEALVANVTSGAIAFNDITTRTGTKPAWANSNSVAINNASAAAALFEGPADATPNWTPKSALAQPNGNIPGRFNLDGSEKVAA